MKAKLLKLFAALVVVSGIFPMVAEAKDPFALVLPATDRMVIEVCYAKAQDQGSGKLTLLAAPKKDFSQKTQASIETYVTKFAEQMGREGFKDVVIVPDKCLSEDDAAGGVTVVFRFYVLSNPDDPDNDKVSPNAFIKVPNAPSTLPIVQTSGSGSGAEKLAALSKAMIKIIRDAQSRGQPASSAAAMVVESKN